MPRWLSWPAPHLPAALLLLFGGASGTFLPGARGSWALAGHLALLAFVGAFGRPWPDPLGLGRRGGWLQAAFFATLAASWLASPVPRAGRLGLILLPAFLLVPSAVARCWARPEARRLGLRSLALAVAAVASGSLVAWWSLDTPGTSLPLGHHNLLAAWLLATLPLAAVPWRDGGWGRAAAALAVASGLASLAGTRSLGAAAAVAAVASAAALRGRAGLLALVAAALLLVPQVPRIADVLAGADASVAARLGYLEAGWRGLAERPALGWGPGAARWTLGEHLRPVPGVHPPDEVVGDLHCLPLELGYELGSSGLLLAGALAWLFLLRRRRAETVDPRLRRSALAGLALLAAVSCFGLPLAVTALPLAAAVGLGAVLAAEAPPRPRNGRAAAVVAAAGMAALVLPLDLAHLAYDRAVDADGADRLRHLRRAVDLDPGFPLYRARLAWLEGEARPGDPRIARDARAAAEDARGSAPLWLVAGGLAQGAGEPWSRDALVRACELSPLGPMAPWRLTLGEGPEAMSEQWAGRALLAEPLLLAAAAWRGREEGLRAAVGRLEHLDGVEPSWRRVLAERAARLLSAPWPEGPVRRLVLEMDGEAPTSASLYTFRRRPWPAYLVDVELLEPLLADARLTAAARLAATDAAVFEGERCGLGAAP